MSAYGSWLTTSKCLDRQFTLFVQKSFAQKKGSVDFFFGRAEKNVTIIGRGGERDEISDCYC